MIIARVLQPFSTHPPVLLIISFKNTLFCPLFSLGVLMGSLMGSLFREKKAVKHTPFGQNTPLFCTKTP